LKEEIQKVREMIELPLRHPEIFEKVFHCIEASKDVLLRGSPRFQCSEEAFKKIRIQREMKPGERPSLSHYE